MRVYPPKLSGQRWRVPAHRGVALALALSSPANAEVAIAQIAGKIESDESSALPLLSTSKDLGGYSVRDLRRLGRDVRPQTTRRLIELTGKDSLRRNPSRTMELLRALSNHEHSPRLTKNLRSQVIRAIASIFEGSFGAEAQTSTQLLITPESGSLRHWIRGTAARALSRSAHPEGLRALLAVALAPGADPTGAELARSALAEVPPEDLVRARLTDLFPAKAWKEISANDEIELTVSDPQALLQLPKFKPEQPSEEAPSLPEALRQLTLLARLPTAFLDPRNWEAAYEQEPVWTLRALAALFDRSHPQIRRLCRKLATLSAAAKDQTEKHAASFLLSVIEPQSLSSEELLRIIEQDEPKLSELMALHNPQLWSGISTHSLRLLQTKLDHPIVIAPLSARLRESARGLGPTVDTVRRFLRDRNPAVRSAAAFGLAEARSNASSGLLAAAYREEADPSVRRAIVGALYQRGLTKMPELAPLLELDPDPGCRARAAGREDPEALGFLWGKSSRPEVNLVDREGRVFVVQPAPDGFVGWVEDSW